MPGYRTKQDNCPDCGDKVKFEGSSPNHMLHLTLTMCTIGLWGIVWCFQRTDYRCAKCGSKSKAVLFKLDS